MDPRKRKSVWQSGNGWRRYRELLSWSNWLLGVNLKECLQDDFNLDSSHDDILNDDTEKHFFIQENLNGWIIYITGLQVYGAILSPPPSWASDTMSKMVTAAASVAKKAKRGLREFLSPAMAPHTCISYFAGTMRLTQFQALKHNMGG